jgi:hypothetical protein
LQRPGTVATSTWLPFFLSNMAWRPENTRYLPRFVDKLLNIHRIECAELRRCSPTDFLSSFGPGSAQGLFSGLKRT